MDSCRLHLPPHTKALAQLIACLCACSSCPLTCLAYFINVFTNNTQQRSMRYICMLPQHKKVVRMYASSYRLAHRQCRIESHREGIFHCDGRFPNQPPCSVLDGIFNTSLLNGYGALSLTLLRNRRETTIILYPLSFSFLALLLFFLLCCFVTFSFLFFSSVMF